MSRPMTKAESRYLIDRHREPQILPFRLAWKRLMQTIKFRVKPSDYLNKKVSYKGRCYKITGETVDSFFISEFPKVAFSKVGNPYKIK